MNSSGIIRPPLVPMPIGGAAVHTPPAAVGVPSSVPVSTPATEAVPPALPSPAPALLRMPAAPLVAGAGLPAIARRKPRSARAVPPRNGDPLPSYYEYDHGYVPMQHGARSIRFDILPGSVFRGFAVVHPVRERVVRFVTQLSLTEVRMGLPRDMIERRLQPLREAGVACHVDQRDAVDINVGDLNAAIKAGKIAFVCDVRGRVSIDAEKMSARARVSDLHAERGTVAYPFGKKPVEWRRVNPSFEDLRALDPQGQLIPDKQGAFLGEGGQFTVYEGRSGMAIKFGRRTLEAERMIVMQHVLDLYGIPHLRLCIDKIALRMVRDAGVILQERAPEGSRSLDGIVGNCENWSDVEAALEKKCGPETFALFRQFHMQLDVIEKDQILKRELHKRGYTLMGTTSFGAFDDGTIATLAVIDTNGGGKWSKNIFYHPSRGWFLLDW